MATMGRRPSKSLGQNFLHDENLAEVLAGALEAADGDSVVEIGPGLGALTGHLLQPGVDLLVIEKDRDLAQWLRGRFPGLRVETSDALDFDLRRLHGGRPVRVIGNLPYYISGPLLAKFTDPLCPARRMVFTLQKEVADRLTANPGTRAYGALTVLVRNRWEVVPLRDLPPKVFWPVPRVDSAAVALFPTDPAKLNPCDGFLLRRLVKAGFSERRKQVRKLLPIEKSRWPELCAELDIPETARAETLSVAQWRRLASLLDPAPQTVEWFDVVDAEDRVIGRRQRSDIHREGLRHRAAHILIFNSRRELFLQKRAPWKDINPGVWDSSAAGHLAAGESYDAAARRELQEELGVRTTLKPIGTLPPSAATGNEFVAVYAGSHDGPFKLAGREIETGAFFPLERIQDWMRSKAGDFSPVLEHCLAIPALKTWGCNPKIPLD